MTPRSPAPRGCLRTPAAAAAVPGRPRRRGLTLVELLIALAILALVAATIGGMLSAVAYGTDTDRDIRQLVARNKMVSTRLNAALRGGRMVLETGSDSAGDWLVMWHRDLDGNGQPSLLEIRRLDFDATAQTLTSYTAPGTATDVLYTTADDFATITTNLMGTAAFPAELWAKDAEAFSITPGHADPQLARTLSYRLSLTAGGLTDVSIGTVKLRNEP
ncbi:MAG: prepilin-type N-terminal cleavage/methylation domain-containing protein [Planctomycetota bacterium]